MGFYRWLTKTTNNIKRKGFLAYAAIVVCVTLYMIASIGGGPPPSKKSKRTKAKKQIKGEKSVQSEREKETPKSPSHRVDAWSKRELFEFLTERKVYPSVDINIDELRLQVKSIYDNETRPTT